MSDRNIIPRAPLYPTLPNETGVSSFRLGRIRDSQRELENEISHYQKVGKKYKRAHAIAHLISALSGVTAAVLSSTGLGISLSGIGVIVGAPLAGIAGLLGFISTAMMIGGRRLSKKITKHEKTISLAESSSISISKLISKALNDVRISDVAFDLILREVEQYHSLKKGLRSKNASGITYEGVDVEAIRQEIKNEYQKKLESLVNIKN